MNKKIAVLGCGWLGFPLAKFLIQQGCTVHGSTTSQEKLSALKENGIFPFLIDLNLGIDENIIAAFLKNIDVLIINIPPRMKSKSANNYAEKMNRLHQTITKSDIKKVLFVSSTSVYGDVEGEVTEETVPQPVSVSGKELLIAENVFKYDKSLQASIIRFGGLIGPNRHPVYQLSKKKEIQNGNFPINLIHLNDCISIINLIIKKEYWGEIFNAVYPYHPTKATYYSAIAEKKHLNKPIFIDNSQKIGKIILSNTLIFVKKYKFMTTP